MTPVVVCTLACDVKSSFPCATQVVVYKTNGAWNRIKDIFGFVRHTVASGISYCCSSDLVVVQVNDHASNMCCVR